VSDRVAGVSGVTIVHEARVRAIGAAAGWLAVVPLLALGLLAAVLNFPEPELASWLGGAALSLFLGAPVMAALFACASTIATSVAQTHARAGTALIATGAGLRIERHRREISSIAWGDVGVAWQRAPNCVELLTASGDELRVSFATPQHAAEFVAMVRARARQRRAYPIALEADGARTLKNAVGPILPAILASLGVAAGPLGWWSVPISLTLARASSRGHSKIELGADGIMVSKRRRKKRYIPYRDLAGVELKPTGVSNETRVLSLVLHGGRRVLLGRWISAQRANLVKALVEEGMRMASSGAEAGAELSALTRQKAESESAWKARVLAAARRGGYRGPALDAEILIGLMRNPAAEAEQRVAAAIAMRGSPAGIPRIRVAAEVSTEPDVREVFEALAADDVDEGRLTRALSKLAR
jgi:hypothetical protein